MDTDIVFRTSRSDERAPTSGKHEHVLKGRGHGGKKREGLSPWEPCGKPSGINPYEVLSILKQMPNIEPKKTSVQLRELPDQTIVGWPDDIRALTAKIIPVGV
ncbi:hypothetical protein PsorP6_007979 [Peronosclerospora sorghi]|uniref:Uncharacterized protein n=1 Tax=Peronosclerospora sorghi TaxID=230839 RepID=A0ACC0WAQ7_9STRA|nr:hypothetical protein PsorP6_007979 [Peronosclerospora sorghi]